MQKPPLNRTMKGRASSMRRHMTKEEFHLLYHFLRMFSWEVPAATGDGGFYL